MIAYRLAQTAVGLVPFSLFYTGFIVLVRESEREREREGEREREREDING
jgi:hypothetical protein